MFVFQVLARHIPGPGDGFEADIYGEETDLGKVDGPALSDFATVSQKRCVSCAFKFITVSSGTVGGFSHILPHVQGDQICVSL